MNDRETKMPKELQVIFNELSYDVQLLHLRWKLFIQLFGTNYPRIELLNRTASLLFNQLEDILANDILIGICRITEKPKTFSHLNLVLDTLFDYLDSEDHHDLIKDLKERKIIIDKNIIPFKSIRDKKIAHKDLNFTLHKKVVPIEEPSRMMFETALSDIRAFLNTVQTYFDKSETAYEHVQISRDGDDLIYALQQAVEFQKLESNRFIRFDWLDNSEFKEA